mmetsp:Transcript_14778/g.29134  ORF Transcript_14778/g.29134 Transcript_14778/m.29134 type:complete len:184 (-) Transcript_14778:1593-2144(-)
MLYRCHLPSGNKKTSCKGGPPFAPPSIDNSACGGSMSLKCAELNGKKANGVAWLGPTEKNNSESHRLNHTTLGSLIGCSGPPRLRGFGFGPGISIQDWGASADAWPGLAGEEACREEADVVVAVATPTGKRLPASRRDIRDEAVVSLSILDTCISPSADLVSPIAPCPPNCVGKPVPRSLAQP